MTPDTTEILADLICAKMLTTVSAVKPSQWHWPDRPIRMAYNNFDVKMGYFASIHVFYDGNSVHPSKRAIRKIGKALKTIFDIQERQRISDQHTSNQMRALDAIEAIVGAKG